jgi:hypothetical protein
MQRVYQDKEWEQTVQQFELLEKTIPWISRFRLTYYSDLKRTFTGRIRIHIGYCLQAVLFYFRCWSVVFSTKKNKIGNYKYLLLLDTNTAYLNCLLPICKQLSEQLPSTDYCIFVPSDKKAAVLAKMNAQSISTNSVIDEFDLPIDSAFRKVFLLKINAFIFSIKWLKKFQLKGWHYLPAIYRFSFQQTFYQDAVKNLVNASSYLFGASDQWFWDSLFFHSAMDSPTNSVIIQHGLIGEFCYPMLSKNYAVWGEKDAELMIQQFKVEAEKVSIVGSPYFDSFKKQFNLDHPALQSETQVNITFFAQPYYKYNYIGENKYDEIIRWFYELAPVLSKYHKKGLLKFHPLDAVSDYPKLPVNYETSQGSLVQVLSTTCLALTVDSAVSYECVMAGIPVIQLSNEYERFVDLSEHYFTHKIESMEALQDLLEDLLTNSERYQLEKKRSQIGSSYFLAHQNKSVSVLLEKFK